MRYDFRKVQKAINLAGDTLRDVEHKTGINNGAISRVLRSGRAHQSTAKALVKAYKLTMADIQARERRTA